MPAARTTRATPLSRDDRRAAIAAATVPLLAQHGAGVTTRQIADAAGVAEGTLFRAFHDKCVLLRAAASAALDPERAVAAIAALPDDLGLHDLVVALARMLQKGLRRTARIMAAAHQILAEDARAAAGTTPTEHPAVTLGLRGAPLDRDARTRSVLAIIDAVARRFAPFTDEFRVTPEAAARILVSFVFGLGPPGLLTASVFEPEEIAEYMLNGVAQH